MVSEAFELMTLEEASIWSAADVTVCSSSDAAVLNADVSAANARVPSFRVIKPTGH